MGPDQTRELERELKFESPLDTPLPDLRDLVGRTERLPQRFFASVYYDTVEKRLWERGITLRYRVERGQSDGTWTLKVPSGGEGVARERTEVSWPGSRETVPEGVADITRGVMRHEPLEEIVELETFRQRLQLHDHEDLAVGEIDDDVVSVLNGPRRGDRFRQVEFELVADEGVVTRKVTDRFTSAGMSVGAAPKLAVALDLPDPSCGAVLLDRKSPLQDVVRRAVFEGLEQLLDHDWRLRLAVPDVSPEDVHKARVASRRLRSNLKTLQPLLDPIWTRHVREDLKWVGAALGEIRDADVLSGLLAEAPAELQALLARDRMTAVERLTPVLASNRYLNLLDRLHAAIRNPPVVSTRDVDASGPGRTQLVHFVDADWRALRRRVRKSGSEPSDRELHQIRIGAKRLRYAAEMAEPVIGQAGHRIAMAAEELQTVLGEHHDTVAAEEWLRAQVFTSSEKRAREISVELAFSAGALVAGEQESRRKLRQSWLPAWKELGRKAKVLKD